jgi:hypothetical protein
MSKTFEPLPNREPALHWDRRRLACTKRAARKSNEAGETPAVPVKSIRKNRINFVWVPLSNTFAPRLVWSGL